MKKYYILFILLAILFSCKPTKKSVGTRPYIIDPSIQKQLDKKTTSITIPSIGTSVAGSLDLKLFINDSLTWDTYSNEKSLETITMSQIEGDTAVITGFMGMTAGLGYKISIFRDTCIIKYFAKTDAEIYKLKKEDPLNYGVYVPCTKYKLTLTSNPVVKKGEVIKGIIELTSDYFYEVSDNKEDKHKAELTGYFVTQPLISLKEQYEELLKKYK